jgi:phenylpyruvate tautomerase PptA (4-oxalocrotonate tautomerase family)
MPMIDVYAPRGIFPQDAQRQLARELCLALLSAEGVADPTQLYLDNTWAYLHQLESERVHTAATDSAITVRIQVLTPPGALDREGQRALAKDATAIVARLSGDPSLAQRTSVLMSEAAEGGWGIGGTAFGREEFAALRASQS